MPRAGEKHIIISPNAVVKRPLAILPTRSAHLLREGSRRRVIIAPVAATAKRKPKKILLRKRTREPAAASTLANKGSLIFSKF